MSGRAIGIVGVLAFALGVGLLTVPAALADDPSEYPSVTQSGAATSAAAVRPDDLPGARGPGSIATEPTEITVVAATEGGFDWTDALIGGAVVLGVVLVVGLAVYTARHHGPPTGRHAPT